MFHQLSLFLSSTLKTWWKESRLTAQRCRWHRRRPRHHCDFFLARGNPLLLLLECCSSSSWTWCVYTPRNIFDDLMDRYPWYHDIQKVVPCPGGPISSLYLCQLKCSHGLIFGAYVAPWTSSEIWLKCEKNEKEDWKGGTVGRIWRDE